MIVDKWHERIGRRVVDTYYECDCGELFKLTDRYDFEARKVICPCCEEEYDCEGEDLPFEPNPALCIDYTPMSTDEYMRMKI